MTQADTRVDPPQVAGTVEQMNGFLDFLRGSIEMKAAGLSEEDARRSVLPSPLMTVSGLLAHLRWVEAYWFGTVLDGQPDRAPYTEEDPDAEFRGAVEIPVAQLLADYSAQCADSRAIAARLDLDTVVPFRGGEVNARWVVLHMIEETGRHAGHLDVIRELLDGTTGE